MKFQNPSFNFFLNGRTDKRTNRWTDEPKAICSPLFQSWGHNDITYLFIEIISVFASCQSFSACGCKIQPLHNC